MTTEQCILEALLTIARKTYSNQFRGRKRKALSESFLDGASLHDSSVIGGLRSLGSQSHSNAASYSCAGGGH
jgi:hypothetical protein